jgi:hypothetical protein
MSLLPPPPQSGSVARKAWFWTGMALIAAAIAVGVGVGVSYGTKPSDPMPTFGSVRGN